MIYIFWSCANQNEAKEILSGLLKKRLVACGSICAEVISLYLWQEKIEESKEVKVILKTQAQHFLPVQEYIQTRCSYKVPEIVQVPIADVNPAYLSWLKQETDSSC